MDFRQCSKKLEHREPERPEINPNVLGRKITISTRTSDW